MGDNNKGKVVVDVDVILNDNHPHRPGEPLKPQVYRKGYVKFVLMHPNLWEVTSDHKKDPDTLYFVGRWNDDKPFELYLGSKPVGGGNASSVFNLKDLQDVLVSEGVDSESVLVYNPLTKKWEDKPLADVLSQYVTVMAGACAQKDGASGLVPAPKAGEQDSYLKGDGTWANPTEAVEEAIDTIVGNNAADEGKSIREIATAIVNEKIFAGSDGSVLSVNGVEPDETGDVKLDIPSIDGLATEDFVTGKIEELIGTAPDTLDTLGEIAQWIADNKDAADIADMADRVTALEETVNGKDGENGLVGDMADVKDAIVGEGGINDQLANLDDAINGEDGLADRVEALEGRADAVDTILNGEDEEPGLIDKVADAEAAIETLKKYMYGTDTEPEHEGDNYEPGVLNDIANIYNIINQSLSWHEFIADGFGDMDEEVTD